MTDHVVTPDEVLLIIMGTITLFVVIGYLFLWLAISVEDKRRDTERLAQFPPPPPRPPGPRASLEEIKKWRDASLAWDKQWAAYKAKYPA